MLLQFFVYSIITSRACDGYDDPFIYKTTCIDNYRLPFNKSFSKVFKDLIESCWDTDTWKRPSFDKIVNDLKTNHDFISKNVDEKLYYLYIKYIDDQQAGIEPTINLKQLFSLRNQQSIYERLQKLKEKEKEKSDVYSYSMIVYEIITNKRPFNVSNKPYEMISKIVEKLIRPTFDDVTENIPFVYKDLIERCWSNDPNDRPSFSQIVFELENNQEFITEKINKDEYFRYIKYIKENQE